MNIVDNEATPTISITANKASAAEPATNGQYTITMTGASDTDTVVSLNYAAGNPATVAVNGIDYTAPTSVTIAKGATMQAGATSSTATVTVVDDSLVEGNETVTASLGAISPLLSAPFNIVSASPTSAIVTIADDPDLSKTPSLHSGQSPSENLLVPPHRSSR